MATNKLRVLEEGWLAIVNVIAVLNRWRVFVMT